MSHWVVRFYLLAGLLTAPFVSAKTLQTLDPTVHEYLQSYCIKCHGPDEDKGD